MCIPLVSRGALPIPERSFLRRASVCGVVFSFLLSCLSRWVVSFLYLVCHIWWRSATIIPSFRRSRHMRRFMTGERIEDGRPTGLLLIGALGPVPSVHHIPLGNGRHINSACPMSCEQWISQMRALVWRQCGVGDICARNPFRSSILAPICGIFPR